MISTIVTAVIAIAVWIEFGEWLPTQAEWVRRKFQAVNDTVAGWVWPHG